MSTYTQALLHSQPSNPTLARPTSTHTHRQTHLLPLSTDVILTNHTHTLIHTYSSTHTRTHTLSLSHTHSHTHTHLAHHHSEQIPACLHGRRLLHFSSLSLSPLLCFAQDTGTALLRGSHLVKNSQFRYPSHSTHAEPRVRGRILGKEGKKE
jgi:hypothetical protein